MLENDNSSLIAEDEYCEDCQIHYSDERMVKKDNKWAMRDRLRSRVLWTAIIGCICTVFSALGVWEKIGVSADGFSEIAGAVGAVLAAFGVLNDPTNREGF